ncbi:MAG: Crp/Fnr family transcriptional regulator [Acidimicrobiales bacterium]|nr:Crp/Fnr family transcriptional regulator [Acidimicrobiales bacterium]
MDLARLLEGYGTAMRVRAGDIVFREGDPSGAAYGVVGGRIRIEVTTPTGGRLVLGVKEPGDLLGELGALDGTTRSATAVAVEDVQLVQASVDEFLRALEEEPGLAVDLLRRVSQDLRSAVHRTTARASADTTQRLAMLLCDLSQRYGEVNGSGVNIDLALSQEDVAGWIGATREATARSLRTLRDRGCVITGRRRIGITDLTALQRVAVG